MDIITTNQAAAALGVTPVRVRQLCQSGILPTARRHGRDWLIDRRDLAAARRRNTKPGRPRKID